MFYHPSPQPRLVAVGVILFVMLTLAGCRASRAHLPTVRYHDQPAAPARTFPSP